jgi:hypothetical protein
MCNLGEGNLITAATKSKAAANFVKCVMRFDSKAKAEKWRKNLLDPRLSNATLSAIVIVGQFPETGFDNVNEYVRWRNAREQEMEDTLAWYRTHYLHD